MTELPVIPATSLTMYRFAPGKELEVLEAYSLEEIMPVEREGWFTWLNVDGVEDVELIKTMCMAFDIHPLAVEDIYHTKQRPKVELYNDFPVEHSDSIPGYMMR